MVDAAVLFDEVVAEKVAANPQRQREQSTIDFPYLDQDAAIEVAKAIYERGGQLSCELDELAAQMGQTLSGTFRMKTAAAKQHGFVEKDGRGKFKLTPLGQRVLQPSSEGEARALGFLNVELYRAIYDKYRGHLLPPTKALEREIAAAGVAGKQAFRARIALEHAARQSGFFTDGEDRLVAPRFNTEPMTKATEPSGIDGDLSSEKKRGEGYGGGKPPTGGGRSVSEVLLAAFDPNEMDEPQQEAVWTLLKFFKSKGL